MKKNSAVIVIFIFFVWSVQAQSVLWNNSVEEGKITSSDLNGLSVSDIYSVSGRGYGIVFNSLNGNIYWTEMNSRSIMLGNISGSASEILIDSVAGNISIPRGIAVDFAGDAIFWADNGTGKIRKSKLDGTSISDVVTGLSAPGFLALDAGNGKLYFSDNGKSVKKIFRSDLNGGNVEPVVIGLNQIFGLSFDVSGNQLFWIDAGNNKIQKIVLSGILPKQGEQLTDVIANLTNPMRGLSIDEINHQMYWSELTTGIRKSNLTGNSITTFAANSTGYLTGVSADGNLALPVELTDFNYTVQNSSIILIWSTKSETNNFGWEIEKGKGNKEEEKWEKVGFVAGKGTIAESQNYSFALFNTQQSTQIQFRLKQIDLNGLFSYSKVLNIQSTPLSFVLNQNYPNPFNPKTIITYQIPEKSQVEIKIFDLLGREMKTLVNKPHDAGVFSVEFDATKFTSGTYIYQLKAGDFLEKKKMTVVK